MTFYKDHRGSKQYKDFLIDKVSALPWVLTTLEEILLLRGFLVKNQDGKLLFSAGNAKDDPIYLQRFSEANPFIPNNDPDFPFVINFNSFSREKISSIILDARPVGFTMLGTDFKSTDKLKNFINNKYGKKVPVEDLDIGIASFVKALPLASVRTKHSCDGHDKEFPQIEFASEIHTDWFHYLVDKFFRSQGYLTDLEFEFSKGNYSKGAVTIKTKNFNGNYAPIMHDLFLASSALRQDTARHILLAMKEKFISKVRITTSKKNHH